MLTSLIGVFLVFRLQLRQLPLDLELVLGALRQRPVIEIVLDRAEQTRGKRLRRRLDQVYPF